VESESEGIMAKSLFTILDEGQIDVLHQGSEATFRLPAYFEDFPSLDDETALRSWAENHNILHYLMQSGLKTWMINIRAVARPKNEETMFHQDGEHEKAQTRIDEMKFRPMTRPGQKSKKVSEAIKAERERIATAMKAAGMDEQAITKIINQIN